MFAFRHALVLTLGLAVSAPMVTSADTSSYFSKETEVVVHVNVRQILNSKLMKNNEELLTFMRIGLEKQLAKSEEAEQLKKALDFDPFRDLDTITFALDANKEPEHPVIVITGKFKPRRFADAAAQAARKNPGVVRTHETALATVYEISPKGDKSFCLCLADPKTLVITKSVSDMRQALGRAKLRQKVVSADLARLLKKTSPKQSMYIIATESVVKKGMEQNRGNQAFRELGKEMKGMIASVNVVDDIQFRLDIETTAPASARKMQDQIGQAVMMAKFFIQGQDNPQAAPFLDILNTVKTSSSGSTASITGHVPERLIRQAVALLKLTQP